MSDLEQLAQAVIQWSALILLFVFGLSLLMIFVIYFIDKTQSNQTIRRNYPVVGRFRYIFEHIGEFFRQYFFAMDREELPFNRAERSWAYKAAKKRVIIPNSERNVWCHIDGKICRIFAKVKRKAKRRKVEPQKHNLDDAFGRNNAYTRSSKPSSVTINTAKDAKRTR